MSRTTLDDIVAHCDSWDEGKHPRSEDGKFGSGGGNPDDDLVTVTPAREERGHRIPDPSKGTFSGAKERELAAGREHRQREGTHFVGDSSKKLASIVAACDSHACRADGPFQTMERKVAHEKGVHDPAAVAAAIGRKALGQKEMTARSVAGRKH
ncbi:MAG: hypothetical protein ACYDAE_27320 [Steroidobacteraceae bacterium]